MTVSSQIAVSSGRHLVLSLGALVSALARHVVAKSANVLRTVQHARMMSALSQLSDHQLGQIGIKRPDIPAYAETLMAHDRAKSAR